MTMSRSERRWHALGLTSAVLALLLTVLGILLTQVLPHSWAAKTTGVVLTVVAGALVILVMVYTCFALKYNYKLFAIYNLGEPELRTDLKRRVLATDDPVPENLTALAAVSSVTSQGNTLRNIPLEMTTAANERPEPEDEAPEVDVQPELSVESEGDEDEDELPAVDARSSDSLVVQDVDDPLPSTSAYLEYDGTTSRSWKKGVMFKSPPRSPASSVLTQESGPPPPMPVYETIDRTAAEARAMDRDDDDDDASVTTVISASRRAPVDAGPLPAHYVGTDDERIEGRLAERPPTPSDDGDSVGLPEAIYDRADGGPEPEGAPTADTRPSGYTDDDLGGGGGDADDDESGSSVGTTGRRIRNNVTDKLARMRGMNLLRRREISSDFNTYQNATAKRGRFLKKGASPRRSDVNDDTASVTSQFDNVSEVGEVDVPHERVSVAPSELSSSLYPDSVSQVDSNLLF